MTQMTHTHAREAIGRPPAPLPARDGLSETQTRRTDRTDGRTDGCLSKDNSLRDLFTELAGKIKASEYVSATRRNVSQGQIYVFRVGSAGALTPDERFRICLQWMKTHQVTNRRAFFEGCAEASNNCQMHHRCIKALKREGLIEKIGREYVFKDESGA
jgi:hypothetical protein